MQQISPEPPRHPGGWNLRSLARYLAIGVASVAVDFGMLALLHERAGLGVRLSASLAFGTSLIFNFLLNRSTMIGTTGRHFGRQAFRYASLVLLNYVILLACLTIAAEAGV